MRVLLALLVLGCADSIAGPLDCDYPNGAYFVFTDIQGDNVTWEIPKGECAQLVIKTSAGMIVETIGPEMICYCDGSKKPAP